MSELDILYEDNHLLVINKPVGLATMGSENGVSVHSQACHYLREKYQKPGKVFLGIVHRLDSMSSGVLVLARTSKAAARLSDQFRRTSDGPRKIYLATVEGNVVEPQGHLRDWLHKNEQAHQMQTTTSSTPGAAVAELQYRVLRRAASNSSGTAATLIAVRLLTGRKHQIRVQFSSRGHAVLGDIKYGAMRRSLEGIALHAWSLTIQHPTKGEAISFQAPVPKGWGTWRPTAEELNQLDKPTAW